MTNNAILHPIRALKLAMRRAIMRHDLREPALPDALPPELEPFHVGEVLPWKGVKFRVGKIVGGDFPVLILVPVTATRGAQLRRLRSGRDVGRAVLKEQRVTQESLAAATRQKGRRGCGSASA
jgi:hypothetical protein